MALIGNITYSENDVTIRHLHIGEVGYVNLVKLVT